MVCFLAGAYEQGVRGALQDYHALGKPWPASIDVSTIRCRCECVAGAGSHALSQQCMAPQLQGSWAGRQQAVPRQHCPAAAIGEVSCLHSAATANPWVRLPCRTVIWHGDADGCVPPCHAEWYAKHIPGAELRLLQGEGHLTISARRGGEITAEVLGRSSNGVALHR